MKTSMLILAILGILGGALGSFTVITFALAAGANSSPEGIRQIKWFLIVFVAFGLLMLGGGVALIYNGDPGLAAIFGVLPLAVVVGWMIVLGIQRWLQ